MAMVALWGCSADEDSTDYSLADSSGEMAIAVTATVEDASEETRTAYSSSNLPDNFGLFVTNSNNSAYSYDNIKWTYSNESWTTDASCKWQGMSQTVSLVAYAPYNSEITSSNKTSISISVDKKQTEENDALLLWQNSSFTPANDLDTDKKVVIAFEHALTKLTIKLVLNDELLQNDMWNTSADGTITSPFTGTDNPIANDSMRISGFKLSGTYDLTSTKVGITASGDTASITPYALSSGDYSYIAPTSGSEGCAYYQCMVLPQEIAAGEMGVSFYVYGQRFHWTSEQAYTFSANTAYTLSLEVREKVISLSSVTAVAWTSTDATSIDAKNSN